MQQESKACVDNLLCNMKFMHIAHTYYLLNTILDSTLPTNCLSYRRILQMSIAVAFHEIFIKNHFVRCYHNKSGYGLSC